MKTITDNKNETAHTPGPWRYERLHSEVLAGPARHPVVIARIPDDSAARSASEYVTNGNLIAAAPELLDLVRSAISPASSRWNEEARALLARIAGVLLLLVFGAVTAAAQTPCTPYSWDDAVCGSLPVVAPPSTTPDHETTRYAFVQASVGKPDRELAYLILLNLDPSGNGQAVQVDFILEDGRRITRFYQLRSFFALRSERLALGLHEMPELGAETYLSVLVTFNAPGAAEIVWHRASDLAEVATKAGQRVARGDRQ